MWISLWKIQNVFSVTKEQEMTDNVRQVILNEAEIARLRIVLCRDEHDYHDNVNENILEKLRIATGEEEKELDNLDNLDNEEQENVELDFEKLGAKARVFYISDYGKHMLERFLELETAVVGNNNEKPSNYDVEAYEKALAWITTVAKDFSIKRGDIVKLQEDGYRNDGVLIWDGEKVRSLQYDIDDYGSVPKEFTYDDSAFSNPYYWSDAVDHNYINWPALTLRQQLVANLEEMPQDSLEDVVFRTHMTVSGRCYNVVYARALLGSGIPGRNTRSSRYALPPTKEEFAAKLLDLSIPLDWDEDHEQNGEILHSTFCLRFNEYNAKKVLEVTEEKKEGTREWMIVNQEEITL